MMSSEGKMLHRVDIMKLNILPSPEDTNVILTVPKVGSHDLEEVTVILDSSDVATQLKDVSCCFF